MIRCGPRRRVAIRSGRGWSLGRTRSHPSKPTRCLAVPAAGLGTGGSARRRPLCARGHAGRRHQAVHAGVRTRRSVSQPGWSRELTRVSAATSGSGSSCRWAWLRGSGGLLTMWPDTPSPQANPVREAGPQAAKRYSPSQPIRNRSSSVGCRGHRQPSWSAVYGSRGPSGSKRRCRRGPRIRRSPGGWPSWPTGWSSCAPSGS